MAPPTTIVFGATGGVGSAVARSLQEFGSKTILAVRDLQKPIPGLASEEEKAGNFERVVADLTKPETVEAAVRQTGAKHAFIYLVHGATDGLRATMEALKAAGIVFVVFLSSASVYGDIRKITPATFVPFAHAQIEIGLEEVFGKEGFIAVRPAYFDTNTRWWASGIQAGELKIAYPEEKFDWLSPDDIGRVSAAALVKGIKITEGTKDPNTIFLCGPKLLSQRDAALVLAKAAGKDVKIVDADEATVVQSMAAIGVPEVLAKQLIAELGKRSRGESKFPIYEGEEYAEASANVSKYAGRSTSLEEWAAKNLEVFS